MFFSTAKKEFSIVDSGDVKSIITSPLRSSLGSGEIEISRLLMPETKPASFPIILVSFGWHVAATKLHS